MAKAEQELHKIMAVLLHIFWNNTDYTTGITHKPYGVDWINLERSMYRLLVLQGKVRDGDKVPEDPWELFLREFAPSTTQRPPGTRQPSTQYFPSSILRSSTGNVGDGQSGASHSQPRVHFEVPPARRENENRRNLGPIPRYFS